MGKVEKIRNINDEFRNFPSQKLNKLSNDRFKFLYLVKRKALESEDFIYFLRRMVYYEGPEKSV